MALTTDIVRTWRGPRAVMRDLLAQGPREDRAVAFVFIACFVIFVAQWPRLSRTAAGFEVAPDAAPRGMTELLTYELFSWVIIWPLMLYALAAVSHLVAKIMGGRGTHFTARMALFWSLLASTPVLLLYGLTVGFMGPGIQAQLVGAVWVAVFGWFWGQSLIEAETGP